jgi:hypothetical protein
MMDVGQPTRSSIAEHQVLKTLGIELSQANNFKKTTHNSYLQVIHQLLSKLNFFFKNLYLHYLDYVDECNHTTEVLKSNLSGLEVTHGDMAFNVLGTKIYAHTAIGI